MRSEVENTILPGTQPTSYVLADLAEGDAIISEVTITSKGWDEFIAVSDDRAAAHLDQTHARSMGYKDRIVHGLCTALPFSRLLGMYLPGPNCVIQSLDLKFRKEVYVGDTLTYRVTVERLVPTVGAVRLTLVVTRDSGEVVCSGTAQCVFPKH